MKKHFLLILVHMRYGGLSSALIGESETSTSILMSSGHTGMTLTSTPRSAVRSSLHFRHERLDPHA